MIQAATAPIIIGLFYIYIRDKYEKEPWQMLLWGLLFGVYATFVIYGVSTDRSSLCGSFFAGGFGGRKCETVVSVGAFSEESAI